ncbi:mechanosensitive ion channel family protein [Haliea sp. E17]|uniref:mechanosensitive ion channel family protein n=1 Tax=Haliea sp. E17 TaxID=3401576 RepID=UPI003AAC3C6C
MRLLPALAGAVCLAFSLLVAQPVAAEDAPVEVPPTVQEMAASLQVRIDALGTLDKQIEQAPERYRDSLVNRRDDRAFRALQELGRMGQAVLSLPENDPQRDAGRQFLEGYLNIAGERVLSRIGTLEDTIDQAFARLDGLSGAERIEGEARVHALQGLRYRYYSALVEIIKACRGLSLASDSMVERFQPMLQMQTEAMVGRMEYTGIALRDLRARQSLEKDNADLKTAIATLSRQQKTDLQHLTTMIGLLEQLGVQTQEFRAVLVQQGQGLSLATLESGAITTLLEETWDTVRDSLVTRVPNFLFNLLVFFVIVVAFYMLGRVARRGIRAACERPGVKMSTLHKNTLVSITGGLVTLMGLLIALAQMGISLGPMLAGLGVAGFIVGFALQDTLGNFAAGGMILIYRPFDVDDYVEVAGVAGLVKKMSLVSTTIATIDNQILVVPNSKIWGDVIKNVTSQKLRRVDMVFGISYGDDIEKAEKILVSILEDHDSVLRQPEWKVKVHQLGDSSVNFIVRPWVKTEHYWDVYWDITREVKMRFDREGVSIPFPQRDVHIYREDA